MYRGGGDGDGRGEVTGGDEVVLSPADRENLKKQQFVKPERINSVLSSAISMCIEAKPLLAEMTKVGFHCLMKGFVVHVLDIVVYAPLNLCVFFS